MGRRGLGRRRFLRGVGGIGMSLPFLEIFAPKSARAGNDFSRYAFLFGGFSVGSNPGSRLSDHAEGPWDGTVTRGTQPLLDFGVTDVTTMVSNLEIPVGDPIPVAGRPGPFHSTAHQVLSTGVRYQGGQLPDVSSDWVAADTLAQDTPFPVLAYRSQPSFYRVGSDGGTDGVISARRNASGDLEQVPPVTSPRLAYENLFTGFVPPDPAEALAAQRLLAMRRSVVDLVADDAGELIKRLGKEDKQRMQRHFDELRGLEGRLEAIDLPGTPACEQFPHPGDDPPIGDAIDPSGGGDYNDYYMNANGYSDEQLRAEIMTDLVHMAFTCDLSRVTSFMLTFAQCFMNMYTPLNMPSDLHEVTHGAVGGGDQMMEALADCAAWHVYHFARLVDKLRTTEDIDGTPILDNTAVVLAFEGGWGYDPEIESNDSPHSTQNMVMLVGGNAGNLHNTPGRHINAQGAHPTAVLNTCLSACGVNQTLGEVPDLFPPLLE